MYMKYMGGNLERNCGKIVVAGMAGWSDRPSDFLISLSGEW